MKKTPKVDMHRKKSQILVVHCSDPRFQKAYRHIIDDLGAYYDLLVVPGASKAIAEDKCTVDNIKLLHNLHHFEAVHILDHVHCGIFGEVTDEMKVHSKMLKAAEDTLRKTIPEIVVEHHLVGEESTLKLPKW